MMISSKMINRVGAFVYQASAFNIPSMTLQATKAILPESLISEQVDGKHTTWRAETTTEARVFLGTILPDWNPRCAGLSKLLQTPSERAARVMATLMPPIEMSWVRLSDGRKRLYVNMEYCLFDEDGEMHIPKDMQRREKQVPDVVSQDMRTAALQDLLAFSQMEHVLAPGFLRQLGLTDRATEVEAMLAQPRQRPPRARQARQLPPPAPTYEVERILERRVSTGRARNWYLVRWQGYDPTWEAWRIDGEVGSPLETWEPEMNVMHTVAYSTWWEEQREEQQRLQ